MARNIIIGSGPAAAGVALALSQEHDQHITVLDLGSALESDHEDARSRLAERDPRQWSTRDLDVICAQPVAEARGELPTKRSYGSDYPFRDVGQLAGVSAVPGANRRVVSPAYGGFSSVWGAQVMPFSRTTFDRWPISWNDIEPHYKEVLQEVPLAGEHDDLDDLFPLLAASHGLPPLAPRTVDVLQRYERHRAGLRRQGIVVGRARLAFQACECVQCGLCMTGCPYSLIYSAAQTFDKLRATGRVRYHGGLLAYRVGQSGHEAFVQAHDLGTGESHDFRADRLFLACGGLGTTRLVLGSLTSPPPTVELSESVQFTVPFISRRPVEDPRDRHQQDFTLNQFNILLDHDGEGYETSQIHCYPYNPAFLDALPVPLRHPAAAGVTRQLLRRITVGLGYLPSWASPAIRVTHHRAAGMLPEIRLAPTSGNRPPMYRSVMRRLLQAAARLDLWPIVPKSRLSGTAKSYHFGGSFPHRDPGEATTGVTTDRWGCLPEWDRVHLVDGSVFPSVPATTFTLTVMANAHRIACEVLAGKGGTEHG